MTHDDEPIDLQRFLQAQDPVFERVCAELAAGNKATHWMWVVFPQLKALGAAPQELLFRKALDRFFDGAGDAATLALLGTA